MPPAAPLLSAHLDHRRSWEEFFYVYPVISRRSKGVSIGINLNPDTVCNFGCAYCEVDRVSAPRTRNVNLGVLERELRAMIDIWRTGELFEREPFASADANWRRLNDIAFSGDGEPTSYKHFDLAVGLAAKVRAEFDLPEVKLVLISDAAGFGRPQVKAGLDLMARGAHEIWAKLDAGTEEYYRLVNRSLIPFPRILDNILQASRVHPLYVQTLFLRVNGEPTPPHEIEIYAAHLRRIMDDGGKLLGVQLYTIARPTPEAWVTALTAAEIDRIASELRARLPSLPLEVFYGNA